jgi:predicted MFS family arabinose efflux permease
MKIPARILPVIVFSQFAATSLWFAGNAVINDLRSTIGVSIDDIGIVTSSIQLGFIAGTIIFAFFSIADRYSPRKLFLASSLLGSLSNLLIYLIAYDLFSLLVFRFLTGFFLAGIYPVGMKIAAGWYKEKLGNAIGLLVGSLVLGTAFPHLLKSLGETLQWEHVIFIISGFTVAGGISMYVFVDDGPFIHSGTKFNPKAIAAIFKEKRLRSSAFGYFGHMWELYTFWALIPVILQHYINSSSTEINISFWAFFIIASGSFGCIVGGIISHTAGSEKVAYFQLTISSICCLISPLMFYTPVIVFITYLVIWGIAVAGDSPQYSTIIAKSAPKELVGSALAITTSIGFSITILSLWLIYQLFKLVEINYALAILALGPILGLLSMRKLIGKKYKITRNS